MGWTGPDPTDGGTCVHLVEKYRPGACSPSAGMGAEVPCSKGPSRGLKPVAPAWARRTTCRPDRSFTPRSFTPRSFTPRPFTARSFTARPLTPRPFTAHPFTAREAET
eukprot:scaffold10865_cov68-Isochrysis_galbana.AAC.2